MSNSLTFQVKVEKKNYGSWMREGLEDNFEMLMIFTI